MMFRKLLLGLAFAVALALLAGAVTRADKGGKTAAPFAHTVIFYLKSDAPADAAEGLIVDAHEMLAKIPSVRELRVGRPAEKSTPGLAKKDYAVGLVIFFDDAEGLLAYDKHPLHTKYVQKHLKNIELSKLAVYDFLDQNK